MIDERSNTVKVAAKTPIVRASKLDMETTYIVDVDNCANSDSSKSDVTHDRERTAMIHRRRSGIS